MGYYLRNRIKQFTDDLYDYYYERRYCVITCATCGQKLAPFLTHFGPRACGWVRVSGKHGEFICHQCYGHGMNWTNESNKELLELVEERNKETDRQLDAFRMHHPWIKIRNI